MVGTATTARPSGRCEALGAKSVINIHYVVNVTMCEKNASKIQLEMMHHKKRPWKLRMLNLETWPQGVRHCFVFFLAAGLPGQEHQGLGGPGGGPTRTKLQQKTRLMDPLAPGSSIQNNVLVFKRSYTSPGRKFALLEGLS